MSSEYSYDGLRGSSPFIDRLWNGNSPSLDRRELNTENRRDPGLPCSTKRIGSDGPTWFSIYRHLCLWKRQNKRHLWRCIRPSIPYWCISQTSFARQHHQTQHSCEKAKGMDKESRWRRNPRTTYNGHCGSQKPMNNAKSLGIGENKEDQCAIEAIFHF